VDDPAASGDPASVLARLMAARDDGLVSAAYCVVKMLAAGEWKCVPEESALVKAYAEKFLGEPDKLSQADGFEFLAKGAAAIRGRVPSADLSVSRALALGHLSRLMPPSAELEKKIEGWAGSLGIERGSDGWGCPEGVALARCRAVSKSAGSLKSALEETKAIRSPVWSVFTALSACVLAARAEDLEEAKLAVDLALDELKSINYPGPDTKQDLLWFKTTYGKLKPCKWCKGSNRINCDYGCDENGQVKKMCAVCNGTGNMPHVSDRIPCQAKVPSGTHTWVENCSKCKGTAALSCRSCRAPWAPPSKLASQLFKSGHCQLCGGRGVLLGFLRHPCVDCYGIGERIQVDRKH
ncbi:MAG TPA: hypothetical protein VI643_06115, partial [Planctomycetota bacterium]|nr:hypothetical protein [Planctomycetota bacterium]